MRALIASIDSPCSQPVPPPRRRAMALGIARLDLVRRQPGPLADIDLAQRLLHPNRQPELAADDPGGIARPPQIGAVDRNDSAPAQPLTQRASLRPPVRRQIGLGVALPAPLEVPVRLTVTGN